MRNDFFKLDPAFKNMKWDFYHVEAWGLECNLVCTYIILHSIVALSQQ